MFKTSTAVLALLFSSTYAAEFATGMNGDEDLGEDITMKGEKFHYVDKTHVQLEGDDDKAKATEPSAGGPEKVSVLETPVAKTHTTFNGQVEN